MQVIFELFLAICTQSALRFINLHYTYGRPICVMEVSEYIFVFYFCTEIYIIYIAQGKYTLRLATSLTNLKDLSLKTRLHCKCCGFQEVKDPEKITHEEESDGRSDQQEATRHESMIRLHNYFIINNQRQILDCLYCRHVLTCRNMSSEGVFFANETTTRQEALSNKHSV